MMGAEKSSDELSAGSELAEVTNNVRLFARGERVAPSPSGAKY
jgi:hypothetical protein